MKNPRSQKGFTLIELLVVIAIIAILASLAVPAIQGGLLKGQLTQTLNNARQLYIAGFSMATDYNTTGDEMLGWPGDLPDREKNPVKNVSGYIERITDYEYLKKPDMAKIMQAPGVLPWDTSRPFDYKKNCPFKIYRVKDNDGSSNLFCATKNFTYNKGLDKDVVPYGDKGFVVFRKGGDGTVMNNKKQATSNLSALGLLPGRTDYQSNNAEGNADYLAQQ